MFKIKKHIKIEYAKKYLRDDGTYQSLGDEIGVAHSTIKVWVRNYTAMGIEAFEQSRNKKYSKELKRNSGQRIFIRSRLSARNM